MLTEKAPELLLPVLLDPLVRPPRSSLSSITMHTNAYQGCNPKLGNSLLACSAARSAMALQSETLVPMSDKQT